MARDDTTRKSTAVQWVEVGVLQRGHGIRGDVIIKPHNPGTDVFVTGIECRLVPKGEGPDSKQARVDTILNVYAKAGKGGLKVTLDGIRDRTHADSLRGAAVFISEDALPGLEEGEFFHADLAGLDVVAEDLEGSPIIGTLVSVMESPAHDIFVVRLSDALEGYPGAGEGATEGQELLVPCVERFVSDIDIDGGRVALSHVLDLAAGLDSGKGRPPGPKPEEG